MRSFHTRIIILGAALLAAASFAHAELRVVATLSDIGWIAERVGGDRVEVTVLCPGHQDPHYLPAKPSLSRKLGKADLLLYNGLELEVGWLPVLIDHARNGDIRPGGRGELDCSAAVEEILEKPEGKVDRSQGDIHPLGNPHYLLDPRNGAAVGGLIAERLAELDPEGAEEYRARAAEWAAEVERSIPLWKDKAAAAPACPIIVYHQHWEYLFHWLGLESIGSIEHRPGINPSPQHVEKIIERGRSRENVFLVAATWDNRKIADKAAERIGAPMAVLPGAVGAVDEAPGYPELFETICARLGAAAPVVGTR